MTTETKLKSRVFDNEIVTVGECFSELSLIEELLLWRDCGAVLDAGKYAGVTTEQDLGVRLDRLPDQFEAAQRPLFHPWYPIMPDNTLCLDALKRRFSALNAWRGREQTLFPYMSDTLSAQQEYDSPDQATGWGSIFLLGGWRRRLDDQHYMRPPVYLGHDVECRVFTKLVYAVLGDNVLVDSGATVVRSIVREHAQIRSHVVVSDSIHWSRSSDRRSRSD